MSERFWDILRIISMILASILVLGNLLLGLYTLNQLNKLEVSTEKYIEINNGIWESQMRINDLDNNMINTIIDEIIWIENESGLNVRK